MNGETVACAYTDFPDNFGFFLPLAGITTVKQIRENSFDIRATSRLNRLYVELAEGQPRLGHGRAPPRHEPFHGAADLLLLRRGHRHFPRRRPVHRHDRADERAGFVQHPRGDRRDLPRHEHEDAGPRGCELSPLGGRVSLRQRRALFGQPGRAALQPDRALLPAPHRRARLDRRSTPTFSAR